ncbi:hypothetical protein LCGC14_2547640 [marine sediment metagenome]|uniref:Uncharacterized protein n=1 Tax=marine sediment metagenome TaxID=412755 RepID=A0A0F9BBP7_9ZZZZ
MKGTEIKMRPHEISKAILTWCHWPGFSGEVCGKCNVTVNTFGHGRGWFCPSCDAYNCQSFSCSFMPWDNPQYGPTLQTIRKGGKLATRDTRRQRKFVDGQKIFFNWRQGSYSYHGEVWRAGRIVSMRESCYCGMRWYNVRLLDGSEHMVYEDYIYKPDPMLCFLPVAAVFPAN